MPDTLSSTTAQALAATIEKGVLARDLELWRTVVAPDAVWWHATGDRVTTLEETMAFFSGVLGVTTTLTYEDIRVTPTATGYIDQHSVHAVLRDGTETRIPAIMVATVEDGMITRLDEYVEAMAAAPIAAALERAAE